jgi:hypothetical protein
LLSSGRILFCPQILAVLETLARRLGLRLVGWRM